MKTLQDFLKCKNTLDVQIFMITMANTSTTRMCDICPFGHNGNNACEHKIGCNEFLLQQHRELKKVKDLFQ